MEQSAKVKTGLVLCWASLVILPLGTFLGAVGICAGPRSTTGAVEMLLLGIFGIVAALYGGFNILRGMRFGGWFVRVFGALSICSAVLVGLVGVLYSFEAQQYLEYVVMHR